MAAAHRTADVTNTTAALNALRSCRRGSLELRLDANTAAYALTGGPANRGSELPNKIPGVIAFADRLAFLVEGDRRAADQEVAR